MKTSSRIRRVLVTTDALGGVWNYALELARGLGRRGLDVRLAVMGPLPDVAQLNAAAELDGVEVCVGPFRLEWMDDPWDDVQRAGEWLLRLEQDFAPDVIHLNGYVHAALPWKAPVLVVGHSCVLSWWEAVKGERAPARFDRYRLAVAAGLRAAREVIAPSRAMLHALRVNYGALPRAGVIPNAIDLPRFAPASKEPFVLGVGRWWDEAKNAAMLSRVAPYLPWPVRLAGEVNPPQQVRPDDLNAVVLLGRCPPAVLASYYARAAIFALPARYEPFGLSVLEAAASGCALVLGDIPSLRENWEDVARFVPPNDEAALREVLQELIRRPDQQRQLGARAQQRAQQFNPQRFTDDYLDAYRRIVELPAPSFA